MTSFYVITDLQMFPAFYFLTGLNTWPGSLSSHGHLVTLLLVFIIHCDSDPVVIPPLHTTFYLPYKTLNSCWLLTSADTLTLGLR